MRAAPATVLGRIEEAMRKYTYLTSDVPTTAELESIREARIRVLTVIKMRWVVLGIFALYGLYAAFFYQRHGADELTTLQKVIPVVAVGLATVYNGWYHFTYRWFSRIRHLNLIQLMVDLLFVTTIVHFSGGAVSWFWAMYFVLILEASFLGEGVYDAWIVGVASSLLYGGLLTAEFYWVLEPIRMPFENNALQANFGYEMLKWAWITVMCLLVSGIGSHMIKGIRRHEETLKQMVVKDGLTELYNRAYFYLRLNSELRRARRYGRTFSLLVLDVDDFKKFNDTYGHQAGDSLLQGVGKVLRSNIRRSETDPPYDIDIPCRVGGEEFAVLLPEASSVQSSIAAERLRASIEASGAACVAERIRRSIESLNVVDHPVTVSVGVASYPEHGDGPEPLFRAADDAMYRAKRSGKNQVIVCPVEQPAPEPVPA